MSQLPLANIRILDLTHVWAGPLGVRFLSDLGAEVVKVEAPFGRGPREFSPNPLGGWIGGEPGDEPWNLSAIFVKLNRNRKSLCLDLKLPRAREIFLELVKVADIVIENFSSRAMPQMGLGYETLKAANPKIIYVSMPGYGMTGPYRNRVAFGPTVEPLSGLTNMLGYSPDEPRNSAMALMDPIAATHAAASVTSALLRREKTGEGCLVEMSLHEGGVTYSGPWLIDEQLGQTPMCIGNRHPEMAPHNVYPSQGEDKWISIACKNDTQWMKLCELVGPELDDQLGLLERAQNHEEIDTVISKWTSARSNLEATEALQNSGIAAGPVNTTPEITADQQVSARGFFVPYERFNTPMPGNPIQMEGIDRDQWTRCPGLGEHNHHVLESWLQYTTEAISNLEDNGILLNAPPP
jgi:crotonobetainyl-CoA:carnitine CoA-transferase CaiB-like acyl-CoA transferase